MRKRRVIDISTDKKKKEVFEIFNRLTSQAQAHKYFGISDNKQGAEYLKQIAFEVGFDFKIYKERKKKPIKYCKQCGKELKGKWQKSFCCLSCAAKYNNEHRDKSVYEKVGDALKEKGKAVELVHKERFCIVCGKKLEKSQIKYCSKICRDKLQVNKVKPKYKKVCEFCGKEFETVTKNTRYCSPQCQSNNIHKKAYIDFLENNEKYCRGNYVPKSFKAEFLKEQNGICAICGCKPEHNGKPLVFVLDHIDGDASNNKRENLRMVCPNCDSQLDTFKSKNKNSTRRNYWKEHIINEINKKVSLPTLGE